MTPTLLNLICLPENSIDNSHPVTLLLAPKYYALVLNTRPDYSKSCHLKLFGKIKKNDFYGYLFKEAHNGKFESERLTNFRIAILHNRVVEIQ